MKLELRKISIYPWCIIVGIACFFWALPAGIILTQVLALFKGSSVDPSYALAGLSVILFFFAAGFILSGLSIKREEHPRWAAYIAIGLNGLALLYLAAVAW